MTKSSKFSSQYERDSQERKKRILNNMKEKKKKKNYRFQFQRTVIFIENFFVLFSQIEFLKMTDSLLKLLNNSFWIFSLLFKDLLCYSKDAFSSDNFRAGSKLEGFHIHFIDSREPYCI